MGELSKLAIDISYRSDVGNVIDDFYVPCLQQSDLYRRAAGYFTSNGLSLAAKGLASLIEAGGKVRLVVSPCLSESDVEAIAQGYRARDEILRECAHRGLKNVSDRLTKDRLAALAWLISIGSLDIKLAIRIDPVTNRILRGIYHEKIGIFSDDNDEHVAFTGSQNETEGGLVDNFESIDVFCSWRDSEERVANKREAFERLWSDQTAGLAVVPFGEVSEEIFARFKPARPPTHDPAQRTVFVRRPKTSDQRPALPDSVELRDYQEQAIRNWFKNSGKGLLQMATGTGKTITALGLATKLSEKIQLQALLIVCPYKHLVTQWARECERFGMLPLLAFEGQAKWHAALTQKLASLSRDPSRFLCVIATNSTYSTDAFQSRLPYFPEKTLFVADEVHNLGSSTYAKLLPDPMSLRLGLSATPERWFDDYGTQRLKEYFGPQLEPALGIKEAIQLGVLVPYRYYPILIELTPDEQEQYSEISAQIARTFSRDGMDEESPILTALLLKRARVVGTAANKLVELRELMTSRRNASHMLIYCGDGSIESETTDHTVRRQVDEVTRLLGVDLGIRVGLYVAETALPERERLRADLEAGRLQGVVAIRCLDEGVDMPSVRTAVILASSTNPRQSVQRRGRVLRRFAGKDSAEIYDMIVVPPPDASSSDAERSLVRRELMRFAEFADCAMNAGESRGIVFDLQKQFGLVDI